MECVLTMMRFLCLTHAHTHTNTCVHKSTDNKVNYPNFVKILFQKKNTQYALRSPEKICLACIFPFIRNRTFKIRIAVLDFNNSFRETERGKDHFYEADFWIWACSDVWRHEWDELNVLACVYMFVFFLVALLLQPDIQFSIHKISPYLHFSSKYILFGTTLISLLN